MNDKLICLCGSAGSLSTVLDILSHMPEDFPIPIVVLIHQQQGFATSFHEVIDSRTKLKSLVPEDGTPIVPPMVYVAPNAYHMQIETDHTVSFALDEPVTFSRPSIDVLLETAARAYQKNLIAVLLSGASTDGTKGLCWVEKYGGTKLIQDPSETKFKTMLHSAIEACEDANVLSIDGIISCLLQEGGVGHD